MFIAGFNGFAFVEHFFTASKSDCDFDFSAFEIDFEWNDSKSFLFKFSLEIFDFAFMHEEFASFSAFVLECGAVFVRFDIEAVEKEFSVFDLTICVGEVGATEVEALNLGAD